jgi:Protein of unknown function (DUF3617)
MMASRIALVTVCLLAFPCHSVAADEAGQSGELWEVTSQMSMPGMPFAPPPQTHQACTPQQWTQPPGGDQGGRCRSSDYAPDGDVVTWTVTCDGMGVGHGEVTRHGADAYDGAIVFSSDDGAATIKLSGRRVGTCDVPQ